MKSGEQPIWRLEMEKYTNEHGKECYKGVDADTPLSSLEFHMPDYQFEEDVQVALHTNLGSLTVLSRMTGFGYRDTETGFRDPDGKVWLASGGCDVRDSDAVSIQDAIEWVKKNANTCVGA